MKKYSVFVIIIVMSLGVIAQNNEDRRMPQELKFGFGLGYGLFYPENLNDYIADYFERKNYEFTSGFPEFLMYFTANVSSQYFLTDNLEFNGEVTGSWAPKVFNKEPHYYHISAVSPGLIVNYHLHSKKSSAFFIGAGLNYNFMKFKLDEIEESSNTPGAIIRIGLMNYRAVPIKHCLTYRYILARDSDVSGPPPFVLSYTGIHYSFQYFF